MPNNKSQKEIRKQVWRKASGLCVACGRKVNNESDRTIEHVIPRALGGTDDQRNLMPLCKQCNRNRATGQINLETYYSYASPSAIDDARSYIFDWRLSHTTAAGEMTVDRFGIM